MNFSDIEREFREKFPFYEGYWMYDTEDQVSFIKKQFDAYNAFLIEEIEKKSTNEKRKGYGLNDDFDHGYEEALSDIQELVKGKNDTKTR